MRGIRTKLTFPYYLYPKFPFAGYQDVDLYNGELLRLKHSMVSLNSETNILFHLTVGASMEEINIKENNVEFQWQQLCPVHIRDALKNGIKVVHWIVAPNSTFGGDTNIPHFMNYCRDLDLSKVNDKHYTSLTYDYTCIIFNTMLPTIGSRRKTILRLNKFKTLDTDLNISKYIQTHDDNIFTRNFYTSLQSTVNRIVSNGGVCTCFSFAVFNIQIKESSINRYSMFPDIENIYCGNNKLICEWMFVLGYYCVYDYNSSNYISYIEKIEEMNDGSVIDIQNINGLVYQLLE